MNIYQKLIEVRKSVPYLKKDNKGFQFQYVSSSQTLGSLREAMDAQGLLLVPRVTSSEIRDHTTRKGDHEYFSIFNMTFTWINADAPEETIECPWTGHGLDDGEKGVGKAMTYAEKYFLLKFFNIATDKDDPDSFQKESHKNEQDKSPPPPPKESPAKPPGQQEGNEFEAKKHDGLDQKQMQAAIKKMMVDQYGEDQWQGVLEEMTAFSTKDGKTIPGKMNPYDLAVKPNAKGETRTSITYVRVREEFKKWEEAMQGRL